MSEDQAQNPDLNPPARSGPAPAEGPSATPESGPVLFDGEDTDHGEVPPDGDELSAEELAAIRESQAAPETEPADAEVG